MSEKETKLTGKVFLNRVLAGTANRDCGWVDSECYFRRII